MIVISDIVTSDEPAKYRTRWAGFLPRTDVAKRLRRNRETLNHWEWLLKLGNTDFEKYFRSLGPGKPWHPYQVELLRLIDRYQYRGPSNPQLTKDDDTLLLYIYHHKDWWTEQNWEDNNYSLEIDEKQTTAITIYSSPAISTVESAA